jgi:hypothetical protein
MFNLKELIEEAPNRVVRETFGEGEAAFTVELRCVSRGDLENMRRKSITKVLDKATRQYKDEVSTEKMREYVKTHFIAGWTGLTIGKVLTLCNKSVPKQLQDRIKEEIPFSVEHAGELLENVNGFEEWVWEKISVVADLLAIEEGDSKNA